MKLQIFRLIVLAFTYILQIYNMYIVIIIRNYLLDMTINSVFSFKLNWSFIYESYNIDINVKPAINYGFSH